MKTLTEVIEVTQLTRFQAVQFLELTGLGYPSIRGKRTYWHIDPYTEGLLMSLKKHITQGGTVISGIKKLRKTGELK